MDLPAEPVNEECYRLVRENAPGLWEAFEARLRPAAEGSGPPAERVRTLTELEAAEWAAILESDPRQTRDIGRSWACVVEDLVGAVARAAIADGASREQLQALLKVLTEEREPTFTGNAVRFDLMAALAG
jgi:hypothetical protein